MSVGILHLHVPAGDVTLDADLHLPRARRAAILFVSAGDDLDLGAAKCCIAAALEAEGLATMQVSLLTAEELEQDRRDGRFHLDLPFLTRRMCALTSWMQLHPALRSHPIGMVASGTASAAVLKCAVLHPDRIQAVVSLEGRADLAAEVLDRVRARTLLLVAERDTHTVDLNRFAASRMPQMSQLEILRGATSSFNEHGALMRIAGRTTDWFTNLLLPARALPVRREASRASDGQGFLR